MTVARAALNEFYATEHVTPNGNHGRAFDWVKAFGMPVPVPNFAWRQRLLPYHDLHHLVTGYGTDEAGEAEVGAWTLGSGGGPLSGTLYDLGAFALGLMRTPRRTATAFYRGRQSRNFYRQPSSHWMDREVDELRAWAGTDQPLGEVTQADRIALVLHALAVPVLWSVAPLVVIAATVGWI